MNENKKIAIFQKKEIRKTIHNNEWWFVIEDVVFALTDSKDPKQYIQRFKQRDPELKKGWVQIVRTLLIETSGGKQKMICANTEGIFRIIQSVPSPKAEPFKRWLAKDGGTIAGDAKNALEKKTGEKVSTNENYLDAPEKRKRL